MSANLSKSAIVCGVSLERNNASLNLSNHCFYPLTPHFTPYLPLSSNNMLRHSVAYDGISILHFSLFGSLHLTCNKSDSIKYRPRSIHGFGVWLSKSRGRPTANADQRTIISTSHCQAAGTLGCPWQTSCFNGCTFRSSGVAVPGRSSGCLGDHPPEIFLHRLLLCGAWALAVVCWDL